MHPSHTVVILVQFLCCYGVAASLAHTSRCRIQPGDPLFPSREQFSRLNSSIDGRLLAVVPSAQFCKTRSGGCTDAEWTDSIFRSGIPGAMLEINWEQDYLSHPPSLCFRNSTTCGQGSVPLYTVNATSPAHIQAGVRFAQAHNLKVAIKASGHDYLGRSTAKNSLLLWTRYFQDITFHDSFYVAGQNKGSAVTVGSGVGLHTLYQACKTKGKIFVGGLAANVVPAGGYVQGAGHSAISPSYGLAADNALEFRIVIADGSLVTANEVSHPNLFWALRGGGAGSWGVIISATLRTFPTFDAVGHQAVIQTNSTDFMGQLATLHAQHIFDIDDLRASRYVLYSSTPPTAFSMTIISIFPATTVEAANASVSPLMEAISARGFFVDAGFNKTLINDLSSTESDFGGTIIIAGSRLVPADVYRNDPTSVGNALKKLLDAGLDATEHVVAGGQVSDNANINSAVHPKWRTAKSHFLVATSWDDSTPPEQVEAIREKFTNQLVPILAKMAGPESASYSNEADVRDPNFQTTFFGDYSRLSAIKNIYDPNALFIVGAGVGSEKWDAYGLCRVHGKDKFAAKESE